MEQNNQPLIYVQKPSPTRDQLVKLYDLYYSIKKDDEQQAKLKLDPDGPSTNYLKGRAEGFKTAAYYLRRLVNYRLNS